MGDDPAAIHCGLFRLPCPDRRAFVLFRYAEAEEGARLRSATGFGAAQLKLRSESDSKCAPRNQTVIASEAKQSSFRIQKNGLLRHFAPRNDDPNILFISLSH